jgi:UrcA family protein
MTRLALIAFVASALLPAAAFAQAETAEVRVDDLNLATQAGRDTLDRRIESAARQVCQPVTITGSRITDARLQRDCKADVRRQVAEKVSAQARVVARN